jgi:nucleoside-diphosphate-sugar epimerase
MTECGGAPWRALSPELAREEIGAWAARIPQPVAITGATGFIGSHLGEALVRAGVRPRLLVRDPARLLPELRSGADSVIGDVEDAASLGRLVEGCAVVVHLAGRLRAARAADFDRTNRGGTEALVAALGERAPAARLVHVSSLAAAGPSRDPAGRNPDDRPAPVSAYGRSKLAGEAAARRHAGGWVILRPPAIYGPRDIDVLQFFRLAARGVVPLPAGERWISIAHVSDAVRAILAAAAAERPGGVLHLGEPEPTEMRALVAALAKAGGVRARVVPVPPALVRALGLAGDAAQRLGFRNVAMTGDKARELLARHWSARTEGSLRALGVAGYVRFLDGASATWAWYRQHRWLPHAKIRHV